MRLPATVSILMACATAAACLGPSPTTTISLSVDAAPPGVTPFTKSGSVPLDDAGSALDQLKRFGEAEHLAVTTHYYPDLRATLVQSIGGVANRAPEDNVSYFWEFSVGHRPAAVGADLTVLYKNDAVEWHYVLVRS